MKDEIDSQRGMKPSTERDLGLRQMGEQEPEPQCEYCGAAHHVNDCPKLSMPDSYYEPPDTY